LAGFVSRCAVLALSLLAFGFYPSAQAQDYPTRPITIVVTLSAGTGMDVIARLMPTSCRRAWASPW
jgi:tripartite-type tricarboxylate transporter receptor subunit TctC